MSVLVLGLHDISVDAEASTDGMEKFLRDVDADYDKALPYFVGTTLSFFDIFHKDHEEAFQLPADIAKAIDEMGHHYELHRIGLRMITSTWAKERFPKANRELLVTMVAKDLSVTHTLLIFL